jgi:surfactin synthase thioesterase subunit
MKLALIHSPIEFKPITLFALPYAGGHSLVYRNFKSHLPSTIRLEPLEPPGRGRRAKEPLLSDIKAMSKDLLEKMLPVIEKESYAIMGHSMGSLLAYLVTCEIQAKNLPNPVHLICSGHGAPSIPNSTLENNNPKHTLSRTKFWEYIESLGAVPPELREHEELMEYFEPILRADLQAIHDYSYAAPLTPLSVPLTVIYGAGDSEVPVTAVRPWANESSEQVRFIPIKGGHFGIFEQIADICSIITTVLHPINDTSS